MTGHNAVLVQEVLLNAEFRRGYWVTHLPIKGSNIIVPILQARAPQ